MLPPVVPVEGWRRASKLERAGVEVPLWAEMEGWREIVVLEGPPVAAAARSKEAWLMPPWVLGWVDMVLPAWAWVLPVFEVEVEGVGIDRAETEEELRWRRDGVGWVAPIIWCVGLGSEMSTGSRDAEVDVLDWEAFDATEADWARRAVSSRVRRLT